MQAILLILMYELFVILLTLSRASVFAMSYILYCLTYICLCCRCLLVSLYHPSPTSLIFWLTCSKVFLSVSSTFKVFLLLENAVIVYGFTWNWGSVFGRKHSSKFQTCNPSAQETCFAHSGSRLLNLWVTTPWWVAKLLNWACKKWIIIKKIKTIIHVAHKLNSNTR